MRKAGISLVALVITIIVLVILTGAVIITGINVPTQAQLAVFKSNVGTVQDAVTMKMLNNMAEYSREGNVEYYKWVGVVSGYTTTEAEGGTPPTFTIEDKIPDVSVAQVDSSIGNNLSESDVSKYYVDANGIVYHEGKEINGVIYYNNSLTAPVSAVVVASIAITTPPTKTTYAEGETFDPTGMVITATYPDSTTGIVTEYTISPSTALATTDTSITITYGGKTTTQDITVLADGTLGALLLQEDANGAKANYGKSINYSVTVGDTTISNWQVWCRATVGGEDYAYIVSTDSVGDKTWDDADPEGGVPEGEVTKANTENAELYNKFKLGQDGYTLVSGQINSECVADLVNNYGAYANMTDYKDGANQSYVVGAIGGATMEMLEAGWKGLYPAGKTMDISSNYDLGYKINGEMWASGFTSDNIYIKSGTYVWLTSPSAEYSDEVMGAGIGSVGTFSYNGWRGVRPAVCLRSNIPVREKQDSDPAGTKDIVITVSQP